MAICLRKLSITRKDVDVKLDKLTLEFTSCDSPHLQQHWAEFVGVKCVFIWPLQGEMWCDCEF